MTHGGGVALYVSDSCIAKRLYNFETPTLEALWVEIKTQTHVLAVCVCYRSQTEGDIFWENIQDSVESIKNAGYNNLIILGDLTRILGTDRCGTNLGIFANLFLLIFILVKQLE